MKISTAWKPSVGVAPHDSSGPARNGLSTRLSRMKSVGNVIVWADDGKKDMPSIDSEHNLKEPASSWHHAMRFFLLMDETATPLRRVMWLMSSFMLVAMQLLVLLAFASTLAYKRCLVPGGSECLRGQYCGGRALHPTTPSVLDKSIEVSRGTCVSCSSSLPNGAEVPGMLEEMCAGPDCLADCDCLVQIPEWQATLHSGSKLGKPKDLADAMFTKHIESYTEAERSCLGACAQSCLAKMTDAQQGFVTASSNAEMLNAYSLKTQSLMLDQASGFASFIAWLTIHEQCNYCSRAFTIPPMTYETLSLYESAIVLRMSFLDYVSLLLASVIVAFTVFREIRDMGIGEAATRQAVRRQKEARQFTRTTIESKWYQCLLDDQLGLRYLAGCVSFLRRYILMTFLLDTVVLLVLRFGGDTVSLMLNTLATLFMLEVDNLAFDFGLSDTFKESIQEKWEVKLHPRLIKTLIASKRYHMAVFTPLIPILVAYVTTWFATVKERQTFISMAFIMAIAVGEVIELYMLRELRSRSGNIQRIACWFGKIGVAIGMKIVLDSIAWQTPLITFVH